VATGLVVGIFPSSDPSALEAALGGQQIDLSKVKVVRRSSGKTDDIAEESQLDFVDVEKAMESNDLSDEMTKGTGVMSDGGGTSVPGLGGSNATLESFSSRNSGHNTYLAGIGIPLDEADNFNEAIEDGRSVVAYPGAGENSAAVATAFKAAGLRNVRTY
jgi:rhodanese-related sulfurtransferase